MKPFFTAFLLFLTTSTVLAQQSQTPAKRFFKEGKTPDGARLEYIDDTPVMFLSGTPEQIGRQHGELVKDSIEPIAKMPKAAAAELGAAKQWPILVFAANALMRQAPKHQVTELKSMIAASGADHNSLIVGNGLIELRRMGGCAAFVVMPDRSDSGKLLFGRNFDFPSFDVLDKYHCVFVIRPEGKNAFVSIGYPGLVGVISGINEHGLAVATLDVYRSADRSPAFNAKGCPLAMTYRRVLEECKTVEEAEVILKQAARTTYMNLVVCDSKTGKTFELTPKQVGTRSAEKSILSCTNHFRVDGLAANEKCWRYERLTKIRDEKQKMDTKDVHKALDLVNQGEYTLQTMIFEPEDMKLHIVMGGKAPVSGRPLKVFSLRKWLAQKKPTEAAAAAQ